MKIIENLETPLAKDTALSIGNFDGMHAGHQHVLSELKSTGAPTAVLTFTNHPSQILRPERPFCLLTSLPHKLKLLENQKIDQCVLIPFTNTFAEQTAEAFLLRLKHLNIQTLVLGHDAVIGKDRHGDIETVQQLAKKHEMHVRYLPEEIVDGRTVSSTSIRQLLREGQLDQVSLFLGRPYSIFLPVIGGKRLGNRIGFSTANLDVEGLCLPPFGVYAVHMLCECSRYAGVANLGIAPTVRHDTHPLLEVHLIDQELDLYGKMTEIIFHSYIRPEMKFDSIDSLKKQIAQDVETARSRL